MSAAIEPQMENSVNFIQGTHKVTWKRTAYTHYHAAAKVQLLLTTLPTTKPSMETNRDIH